MPQQCKRLCFIGPALRGVRRNCSSMWISLWVPKCAVQCYGHTYHRLTTELLLSEAHTRVQYARLSCGRPNPIIPCFHACV